MKTTNNKLKLTMFLIFFLTAKMFAQNFVPKTSGTSFILYDISIPPSQNLVAYAAGSQYTTGNLGIIVKSVDAGETWQTIYPTSGTIPGFKKIKFVSNLRGFVAGQGNTLLKTIDGGTTWTNITVQNDIYYYACLEFFDVNKGFLSAVTNSGNVIAYKTIDSGETWTPITNTANLLTQDVTYASENVMYSTGSDQKVSKSINGGDTWSTIKTGTPTYLYFSIDFKDDNNGILSGEDGEVLKTVNGGTTWTQVLSTGYENLYGLYYTGNTMITAGTDQNIYYSNNNGASFTPLNTSATTTPTLYDIEFFDNNDALLSGSQGTILKSQNLLSTSTNTIKEKDVKHFYNSNSKLLSIEANSDVSINQVQLLSTEGKTILSTKVEGNAVELDLNTLAVGVYVVKLFSNDGVLNTFKFIKN